MVIIADAAGTTKVFEFPYGIAIGDTAGPNFSRLRARFLQHYERSRGGRPQQYPVLAPYAVTLVASIERRNTQADVYVALDAMDVEATYSDPTACRPSLRVIPGACVGIRGIVSLFVQEVIKGEGIVELTVRTEDKVVGWDAEVI